MIEIKTLENVTFAANEWKPLLTKVNSLEEAADNINFPHEDYPDFVDNTLSAIEECISIINDKKCLVENDIKWLHKIAMDGKEYIELGNWRKVNVVVSSELIPPQPYLIPQFIMNILPLEKDISEKDLLLWYKRFESIHPFEDGNGRVGGIILASISYLNTGKCLVPKMEFDYTINPIINRISNINDSFLNNANYFDLTIPYKDRCLVYLESKIKNPKVDKILTINKIKKDITSYVKNGKLEKAINLLKKIK